MAVFPPLVAQVREQQALMTLVGIYVLIDGLMRHHVYSLQLEAVADLLRTPFLLSEQAVYKALGIIVQPSAMRFVVLPLFGFPLCLLTFVLVVAPVRVPGDLTADGTLVLADCLGNLCLGESRLQHREYCVSLCCR